MEDTQENNEWFKQLYIGIDCAYKDLFEQYYSPLVLFADSYINNIELAREKVQNIFLKLIYKKNILTINNINFYLYTSIRKNCLKYLLQEKKNQKQPLSNISEMQDIDFWNKILEEEVYRNIYNLRNIIPQYKKPNPNLEDQNQKEDIFKLSELIAKDINNDLAEKDYQIIKNWEEISLYNKEFLRCLKNEEDLIIKFNSYSKIDWKKDYSSFIKKKNKKAMKIYFFLKRVERLFH